MRERRGHSRRGGGKRLMSQAAGHFGVMNGAKRRWKCYHVITVRLGLSDRLRICEYMKADASRDGVGGVDLFD